MSATSASQPSRLPGRAPAKPPPLKRMTLAEVTTQGRSLPARTIVHGPPGVGKTEFGASWPNPVFLMTKGETGLLTLMQSGRIPSTAHFPHEAESWSDILDAVDAIVDGEHEYKTFVLDTLNGAERLAHEHVCRQDFNNDFGERGFMGFQRGFTVALGEWRNLLFRLDKVRERGIAVLCLCHTKVGSIRNPMGPDYDCFVPSLHKETWNVTTGWADLVLYAQKEVVVQAEKGKRAKGFSGGRVFLTEGSAAYEAKNRHGLPPEISMGESGSEAWRNLQAAMLAARTQGAGKDGNHE